MAKGSSDQYSAGEQGLGYIYQPRFALLKLMQLPEETSVWIEKDDDLDFVDSNGVKTLGSLKHKAEGERVTDLSVDFWKSVRIWLARYNRDGRVSSNLKFFLFTTASVSDTSFLKRLVNGVVPADDERLSVAKAATEALAKTRSERLKEIGVNLSELDEQEKEDFFSRIVIFDDSPRISDVSTLVKDRMRGVRRADRDAVFERLEGWWNESTIKLLEGTRDDALTGFEVSDKIAVYAEEYQTDNLPITLRGMEPSQGVDADNDTRLFVVQLREIGVQSNRIRNAILDYYRAFEQRSSWAREHLLVSGELEDYEERLVDEWSRYRDVVFEELAEDSANDVLLRAGRELYQWAEIKSGNVASLRIRERVTEPYVVRGGFHILANFQPTPKVYWHPRFLGRIEQVCGAKK